MFLWALFSRNGCFKCERSGNIYMIVLFFFALLVLGSGRPPPSAAAHRPLGGGAAVSKNRPETAGLTVAQMNASRTAAAWRLAAHAPVRAPSRTQRPVRHNFTEPRRLFGAVTENTIFVLARRFGAITRRLIPGVRRRRRRLTACGGGAAVVL